VSVTPEMRFKAAANLCERAAAVSHGCGFMASEVDSPRYRLGWAAIPLLGPVFRRWEFLVNFDPDELARLGGEETLALADAVLASAPREETAP
jgi:hypothetical protein